MKLKGSFSYSSIFSWAFHTKGKENSWTLEVNKGRRTNFVHVKNTPIIQIHLSFFSLFAFVLEKPGQDLPILRGDCHSLFYLFGEGDWVVLNIY